MKAQPRFPELAVLRPLGKPRGRLDDVLDRLAVMGYRVDVRKWERFEHAHLVTTPMPTERGEREAIRRLRRILDVERRLAPTGDIDALCFHLAAAGIENVPTAPVARHVTASVSELFVVGDHMRMSAPAGTTIIGPDGEFRIGRAMAARVLARCKTREHLEKSKLESLLGAAFVAYVRSTYANPRPAPLLHVPSRIVSLDVPDAKTPLRSATHVLPPLSDRGGAIMWLNYVAATDGMAIVRAAQSVAALIRLHVHHFPELQAPWRDVAAQYGPAAANALQAIALVPPVLTAAYLQAGAAPVNQQQLDAMLAQLMHYWGTVCYESVRFSLSNGTFPWVTRR